MTMQRENQWSGFFRPNEHFIRKVLRAVVFAQLTLGTAAAHAAEIGHFAPGVSTSATSPCPSRASTVCVYTYATRQIGLNDANGNEIDSVTISPGPGPGVTLD